MRFTSAKQAIHYFHHHQLMSGDSSDALIKLGCRVQYSAKGTRNKVWIEMELGDLVRPINQLPPLEKAWCDFAYASSHYPTRKSEWDGFYTTVQYMLIQKACIDFHNSIFPASKLNPEKLLRIVIFAIDDFKHRENTGRGLYSDEKRIDCAAAIGIHRQNWDKIVEPRVKAIQGRLGAIAQRTLGPVYAHIRDVYEADYEVVA